jgi:plasmid stabilization system protein ParE
MSFARVIASELSRPAHQRGSPAAASDRPLVDRAPAESAGLVLRELARATSLLSMSPMAGKVFRSAGFERHRRLLFRRSRFHVYYLIDETARIVVIVAIWNAVRGHGPALP